MRRLFERDAPFGVVKFRSMVLAGSLSAITEFLMGFLGSVLSGNFLGEDALAGVSLLSPLMTAMIFVSALFGSGMGVNFAREMGRCAKNRAWQYFTQALWSVLAVGAGMSALIAFGGGAYVRFLDPGAAAAAHALGYLRWYAPVAVLEPLTVLLLNVCYVDGDARQCYLAYAVQLVANLAVSGAALDAGWGTAGCALGATVGFATAAAVLSLHFFKHTNSFRLVAQCRLGDTLRIVRASFGDASSFLCDSLLFFFLGKAYLTCYGDAQLPVLGVVLAALGLLSVFGGIGIAVQPIVAVYLGERNTLAVRQVMRAALRFGIGEGLAASFLFLLFPRALVALVGVDEPALVAASETAVRLVSAGFVLKAVSNVLNGYYVLIERELLAVVFTVWFWLVANVIAVSAAAPFGANGMWGALGLAPFFGFALFQLAMSVKFGRAAFPLLLDGAREAKIRMFDLVLDDTAAVRTAHEVGAALRAAGTDDSKAMRAELMTEEVLMSVRDRNAGRRIRAEVTLDLNDTPTLTLRDDGEIFDITDTDQRVRSLRTFLVASVMERHEARVNLVTSGFNRNVFRF